MHGVRQMSMAKADPEREERRRQQKEIADSLKESGALDEIFARIDAGEPLTGHAGLLRGMIKAALERGLEAELTDHLGYERGDPAGGDVPELAQRHSPKTVATRGRRRRAGDPAGPRRARSRRGWCPRAPAGSAGWTT